MHWRYFVGDRRGDEHTQTWSFTLASGSDLTSTSAQAKLTEQASTSSSAPPPTTTTIPTATTAPTGVPVNYKTSGNWSGYELDGSGFTDVSGTFSVPTLYNTLQCNETASQWVGVDGAQPGDTSLIQAGISESETDPDTGLCGAQVYYIQAWYEVLPAAEVPVTSLVVKAGDSLTVTISGGQGGAWGISLTDNTSGQGFNIESAYSGPASSAEWITEAYTIGGTQTPIAPFSPVKWSGLQIPTSATVSEVDAITLQQGGDIEAQPSTSSSLPNLLNSGFTTTYVGNT